jgi:hypothetical protein
MNEIAELAALVREQMTEISRLRGENERLKAEVAKLVNWAGSDCDALMTLQSLYSNPGTYEGNRLKAAASALPFERPRPPSAEAKATFSLFNYLESARLRELERKTINQPPKQPALASDHGGDPLGPEVDPAA